MAIARPAARAQFVLIAFAFGCLAWSFATNNAAMAADPNFCAKYATEAEKSVSLAAAATESSTRRLRIAPVKALLATAHEEGVIRFQRAAHR